MDVAAFYKLSVVAQAEYLRPLTDDQLWDWSSVCAAHVNTQAGSSVFDELTILAMWTASGKITRTRYNRLAQRNENEVGT